LAHDRSSLLPLAPLRERMTLAARDVIAFVAALSRAKKRTVGMLSAARLVAVVGAEGAGFRRGLPWPCRIHVSRELVAALGMLEARGATRRQHENAAVVITHRADNDCPTTLSAARGGFEYVLVHYGDLSSAHTRSR